MGNSASDEPVNIGSRLELFVDRYLIDRMSGTELRLNHPVDAGNVLSFDQPWEGPKAISYQQLDLSAVRVRSFLNGRPHQDSPLDLMISALPRLIELITRYLTLEPGDIILTGTPAGAGFAADGDVVECVIDGIGRLRNAVRKTPDSDIAVHRG